jgi:arabinofuranosyltransferase
MGAAGIDFGPYIHLLDECALADPLLARLPAVFNPAWRTGHYRRMIPNGYRESLQTSANLIQDPDLHRFYDQLRLVTRSERFFTTDRLRAIVALNTGRSRAVVNETFYRHSGVIAPLETVSAIAPAGTAGTHVLKEPLAITCPWRKGRRYLDITLDSDDRYVLTFLTGGRTESTLDLGPIPVHRRQPGLTDYTVDVPGRARANGFDTIVVTPIAGTEPYTLGHLLLEGNPATDGELYRRVTARN